MTQIKAKHQNIPVHLVVLLLFIYFTAITGSAQSTGIWNVGPIAGFDNSEDLVEAKQNVINKTRASALKILLRRIVVKEHLKKLIPLDDEEIALLEGSRQIIGEKFGGNNYSAHLSFEFISKAVEEYLQVNNVTYSLSNPDTLLVIADGINLPKGSKNNPASNLWQDVFEIQNPSIFISNPIVLSATVEDEIMAKLRSNDLQVFNMLKDLYRVDAVVVIWLDPQEYQNILHMTHNRTDILQRINFTFPNQYSKIGKDEMILLRSQIESYWRQEWFKKPITKEVDSFAMDLLINYPSLRQFIVIQSLINNINNLIKFELLETSLNSAIATLTFSGSEIMLIKELYKRGLLVDKDTISGVWNLQTQ